MDRVTTLGKGKKQWIATLQVLVATFMESTGSLKEMMPD
jgi:hypothetical protein